MPKSRNIYEKYSEAVWETVRCAYVGGESPSELSVRFGIKVTTIRWRAREHFWREAREGARLRARRRAFEDLPPWADLSKPASEWTPPPGWYDAAPPKAEPPPLQPPAASPEEAARDAFSRSAEAMARGLPDEAQRWARLAAQMGRLGPRGGSPMPAAASPGPVRHGKPEKLTDRYPIPAELEARMAPFVAGGAKYRAETYASGRAKAAEPGFYSEDLTDDEAALLGGEHFKPGGEGPTDPDHVDDGLDMFRYYQPGKVNQWEMLTLLAEKRLDMLLRDWWTGGRWNDALGLPEYVWDRQEGRVRRTRDLPDPKPWFDAPRDLEAIRAAYDRPLPPVAALPAPPLRWVTDVWMNVWNHEHPEHPVNGLQAITIHQLWTRDPRLESELTPEEQFHARALWHERWAKEGVEPVRPKAAWTEADEARAAERERVWAETLARREAVMAGDREAQGLAEDAPARLERTLGGFRGRVV